MKKIDAENSKFSSCENVNGCGSENMNLSSDKSPGGPYSAKPAAENKAEVRELALKAMMTALISVLAIVDNLFLPPLPVPVPVRYGLANIVIMFAAFSGRRKFALAFGTYKVLLAFLTRGYAAFLTSAGGTLFSIVFILFGSSFLRSCLRFEITGVTAAILHNLGQLIAAVFFLKALSIDNLLYIIPFSIFIGSISGYFSAVLTKILIKTLQGEKSFKSAKTEHELKLTQNSKGLKASKTLQDPQGSQSEKSDRIYED